MLLSTLGTLRLDAAVAARRPKPLLLVAYLALEGGRPREHLATLFWPEATDRRNRLSVSLSRLRREAPGAVEADAMRVWTSVRCDALTLQAALERGDVDAAERVYGGAFVADVDVDMGAELEEWVLATREYLADRLRDALLTQALQLAGRGDFERAALVASRAISVAGATLPSDATIARVADLLAAGAHDRSEAWRRTAHREGVTLPFDTDVAAARERLAAEPSRMMRSNTDDLPSASTSFVGRERALAGIAELFDRLDARLVTVLGPGGMGKTRLALEVARERARTPGVDAVYHVPLGGVQSAADVPAALVSALALPTVPGSNPLEALRSALASQRVLLVLDELEHIDDGAQAVTQLLAALPSARWLVTSRRRLDIEEEHVWQLAGLAFAAPEDGVNASGTTSEAAQLFVHRARRARADLTLDDDDLEHVARICRLVEGVPLALELAAVWVRASTPGEIADAVAASLDALTTPSRNIAPGHRSMRAVFDRSWSLLSPTARRVSACLSVLPDGATAELAARVARARAPDLAQLCDASLLERGADGRYRQHTLLRQYAFERLADDPDLLRTTERRLLAAARRLAHEAEPHLNGPEQSRWFAALERELGTLRSALTAARVVGPAEGVAIAYALRTFWTVHSHLGALADHVAPLVEADVGLASAERARALYLLALPQPWTPTSRARVEQALDLARVAGDAVLVAECLQQAGWIAHALGHAEAAEAHHRAALKAFRALSHTVGESAALNRLGALAYFAGAYAEARDRYEASLALELELGNAWAIASRRYNLGIIAKRSGSYAEAARQYRQALRASADLGDRRQAGWVLEALACLAAAEGRPLRAATLWGAVESERRRAHRHRYGIELREHRSDVAAARAQADGDAFDAAWAHGARLGFDAVLADALAEPS